MKIVKYIRESGVVHVYVSEAEAMAVIDGIYQQVDAEEDLKRSEANLGSWEIKQIASEIIDLICVNRDMGMPGHGVIVFGIDQFPDDGNLPEYV